MIADSIEHIYDGEQFYYSNETPQEELLEFVESLSQKQFAKIETFFANLPKLQKKIEMKCSRCGFQHNLDVEGLESFFG
jgi:folate-dependent tRNA-U54 methylase TrmFO/GidA